MSAYRHGNTFRAHGQFLRAAAQHDNDYPYDDAAEAAADARDEAIDELLADPTWLAKQTPVADEQVDGMQDSWWYGLAEQRLADLDGVPDDKLIGSDLLTKLRSLAESAAKLRAEKLREIAEAEVDARGEAE